MTIQDPEVHPDQIPLIPIKEQERLEALKSDTEKLHKLANELHMIQYPEMSTEEGKQIVKDAEKKVGAIYSWLFNI